ncbi:MAG: hypothetical protein JWN21_1776 [Sphingomonas bacterium]|uniref:hypothetical protein n=1 Tax=Sphingomonas bacterium TaxID=1895847 RepID=UPI002624F7F0|nr:hypothetical protein [Sphingomonas bacterium]MDB5696233.1 hypothetical protein [Sphingomonas bacterium]
MSIVTLNTWDIAPQAAGFDWIYWKSWLSLYLKVPDDMLHVQVGLLLLTVAALALRRAPWDWRPWLVTLTIESANEIFDVFQTAYSTSEGNWSSAWHDLWLTMLWPTVILLCFPWLSRRAARRTKPRTSELDVTSPPPPPEDL